MAALQKQLSESQSKVNEMDKKYSQIQKQISQADEELSSLEIKKHGQKQKENKDQHQMQPESPVSNLTNQTQAVQ